MRLEQRFNRAHVLQACQGLLLCLPPYAELVRASASGLPLWEADSVLASRMQFLMSMLGPCIPQLTQASPLPQSLVAAFL
jgi:hypothetical protein